MKLSIVTTLPLLACCVLLNCKNPLHEQKSPEEKGVVTMGRVTIERVGQYAIGSHHPRPDTEVARERNFLVSWSGENVAAIFQWDHEIEHFSKATHHLIRTQPEGDINPSFGSKSKSVDIDSVTSDQKNEKEGTWNRIVFEKLQTADITADGVEELIVPYALGQLSVYDATTRLHYFQPSKEAKRQSEVIITSSYRARLPHRDIVFYAYRWRLRDDDTVKESYSLVKVDKNGVTEVALKGLDADVEQINAIGAIVDDKKDEIDEIVLCISKHNSENGFISRHKLNGDIIGPLRKIYVDFTSSPRLFFNQVARSAQLLAMDASGKLYFLNPQKPANWIHLVDFNRPYPQRFRLLGYQRLEDTLIASVLIEDDCFMVDDTGQFYTMVNGKPTLTAKETVAYNLQPQSQYHKIIDIVPGSLERNEILVVQSSEPQTRKIEEKELIEAYKKFIGAKGYALHEKEDLSERELSSDEISLAQKLAKEKGLTEKVATTDDVKKYVPEYYDEIRQLAKRSFLFGLEQNLLDPDLMPDNPNEYKTWLATVTIPTQTTITLFSNFREVDTWTIPNYFKKEAGGIDVKIGDSKLKIVSALLKVTERTATDYKTEEWPFVITLERGKGTE